VAPLPQIRICPTGWYWREHFREYLALQMCYLWEVLGGVPGQTFVKAGPNGTNYWNGAKSVAPVIPSLVEAVLLKREGVPFLFLFFNFASVPAL